MESDPESQSKSTPPLKGVDNGLDGGSTRKRKKRLRRSERPKGGIGRNGGPQCIARAHSTGNRCRNSAHPGRDVCDRHGGLTPLSPTVREGRFSQLPSRLKAAYDRSLADASLLDHRPLVALLNALVEDLAQRMAEGDTTELRARAAALCDDALLALGDDLAAAKSKLERAAEMLHAGLDTDEAAKQLFTWTERLGVRVDEAWRIRLQRIQVINAADIATMLAMLLQRVRTKWGEEQARELAEMFEALLADTAAAPGRGEIALAAIPIEGQTVAGGTPNGNAATGS